MSVTFSHEISGSCFISLSGAAKLKLSCISLLSKIGSSLLSLVKIVVGSLNATILIRVLSSLESIEILCSFNFFLITRTFFLQLG